MAYDECIAYIQQKQWPQAAILLQSLPKDAHTLEMQAYVAKQMGDVALAEQALKAALALEPTVNRQALLAALLYQQQRFVEARALWQQVLQQQPQSFQAQFQLAQCYLAIEDYLAARPYLEWCQQQKPDEVAVLFQLATLHCQLEQEVEARAYFEAVLQLEPYHLEALNNYGVVSLRAKDYDKAIHCFATAMRIDSDHLPSRANLAQVLLQAGRYVEARDYFEQYLQRAPTDLNARYNAGVVALLLADRAAALEQFQAVLVEAPDNVASLLNLAAMALQQQETSNAIGYYQRVLNVEPAQPIATYMLAALLRQDTPQKAPAAYVSALFDQYATHFDRHLSGALQYQTPQHLRQLYDRLTQGEPLARLLDLGCGTGLSGAAFADVASLMIGVDLSEAMLAKARDKQLYRDLLCQDMVSYLQQAGEGFDAMIAADVLVYLGDLSDFFEQAALRLNDQGWLLCSLEVAKTEAPFELTQNGRFQHALSYIRQLAQAAGLHVVRHEKATLRLQEGEAVAGQIIALQKRRAS